MIFDEQWTPPSSRAAIEIQNMARHDAYTTNRTMAEVLNNHTGYSDQGLRSLKKTLCNYADYRFSLFELEDNT
jgi:hypothetical protein